MKTMFQRWFSAAVPSPLLETTEAMARRGIAEAQFSLGLRYANGKGAAQDYAQAEHWYLKAAGQDHPLAHFNLGMMHANGQGVPSDRAKSLVWIHRAAELGDPGAQYSLGLSHHRAVLDGLPADASQARMEAYKWLQLAAAQGYKGAEIACEIVNLYMTQAEVLEGRNRVAAFNSTEARAPQVVR